MEVRVVVLAGISLCYDHKAVRDGVVYFGKEQRNIYLYE